MVVCSVRFACNQCNGKRDGRTIVYRRTIFLHNIKILFPDFLSCVRPNLKIKKMIFSTWNFLEKPAENCSETFANINRDFYGTHRNWCEVMAMNYPRFIWRWGSHQHECWFEQVVWWYKMEAKTFRQILNKRLTISDSL